MKLTGDPQALEVLKRMHKANPGFMKALIDDARTTTDHTTFFRSDAGQKYKLTLDPHTGNLDVQPQPASIVPPKD
jgi:hypothetical protein